jgi:RNA polymerase sigma-70 factor (ECF subfamily)
VPEHIARSIGREYSGSRMDSSHDGETDERLVRSARSGDDEAFSALVRRYKRKVFAIAGHYAHSGSEVEDICQETFVKAYRGLAKYRGDAPFDHWLSRIAVRTCYDALRKRRKEERDVPLESVMRELEAPGSEDGMSPVRAREILDSALARLRPEERLVVTLLELEGKTVREVAGLTGWSEGNVKVRAHRARKALKIILESDG